MPEFLQNVAAARPIAGSDRDRIRQVFGASHYIHLYRADKVAQAVSLVLAKQTGLWHLNEDKTIREGVRSQVEPRYDEVEIEKELNMLEAETRGWAAWFDDQSIHPISVSYESLASDPQGTLRRVLAGISQPYEAPLPQVSTFPTRTEVNAEWAERFKNR